MNKEQQDLAWACLPREVRDRIRIAYKSDYVSDRGYQPTRGMKVLQDVFGFHNLTSDTEPSELLFVERKKVLEYYKDVQLAIGEENGDTRIEMEGRKMAMRYFFGDKCLPDKEPSIQGEPKFRKGDKVKVLTDVWNKVHTVVEVKSIYPQFTYKLSCSPDVWFAESTLEPYTEPESRNLSQNTANCDKHEDNQLKDNMEGKELNLCELLKGCERESNFILQRWAMFL